MSLRIAIVGYGRMGKEIEALAAHSDCVVVCRLDIDNNTEGKGIHPETLRDVDVAIDFSTPDATVSNLPRLAALGINTVIGTTGWNDHESDMQQVVNESGIGVVVASNFSLGVNLFQGIVEHTASLMKDQNDFHAWIHETHHAAKVDSPSGTALSLEGAMRKFGITAPIDIASNRVGSVPGTHTVGFDGTFETITLTHTARSRSTFALGALAASHWVKGRQGWFTMRDVLSLSQGEN